MADLKAELLRMKEEAKRKREEALEAAGQGGGAQKKRYIRRGEEAENTRRESLDDDNSNGVAKTTPKRDGDAGAGAAANDDEDLEDRNLPEDEIIRRLRLRNEPIKLFGEDLIDVFRRLRNLEIEAPLDVVRERQRNEYMEAMTAAKEDLDKDDIGDGVDYMKNKKKEKIYDWGDVQRKIVEELSTGDFNRDQKILRQFFKALLQLWQKDLDERAPAKKHSPEGKRASAIYKQSVSYLQPLLKHLKVKDTPPELVPLLAEIAKFVQQREYQKANDAYLRMAIGKAAWPIGVTNVGIHSRTGREKIFAQHIAHILNDEESRKYIQSLKRLMSYCQTRFPTDPSKSFECGGVNDLELYPIEGGDF
eukprot:m.924364 g.924364  ORF g.924364 m.924364 type:complete len:363 (+) comp23768_c0_seq7:284-1372(+)